MDSRLVLSDGRPVFQTGWTGRYLFVQTSLLVLFAAWSLGGRADGAIFWIGCIAWSSLLGLFLNYKAWPQIRRRLKGDLGFTLFCSWCLLIAAILIAPMNSEGVLSPMDDGSFQYVDSDRVLGWLPTAFVRERCLEYAWLWSGVMVQVMVLWFTLQRMGRVRQLLQLIAANSVVLAIIGAGFRLLGSDKILGLSEPVHSGFFASFRYHNHWTAFALLGMGQCLALAVYYYYAGRSDPDLKRQHLDVVWGGALLLVSMTLPMSTARAGVLFLGLFWFCIAGYFFVATPWWRSLGRGRVLQVLTGAALMIGIVVYSVWLSAPQLRADWLQSIGQYEQLKSGEVRMLDVHRMDSWGDCWRMFQDRPIWGGGVGSHRYLYALYARDEYRFENGAPMHIKEFAHNDWMQSLAEFGLVGMFLLLAPPVALLVRYCGTIRKVAIARVLLLPCGLILLLATFEFPLSNPAVLVVFAVQGALGFKVLQFADKRELSTVATGGKHV